MVVGVARGYVVGLSLSRENVGTRTGLTESGPRHRREVLTGRRSFVHAEELDDFLRRKRHDASGRTEAARTPSPASSWFAEWEDFRHHTFLNDPLSLYGNRVNIRPTTCRMADARMLRLCS